jgi:hypothetical protein
MYNKNSKNRSKKLLFLSLISAALITAGVVFVLDRKGVIHLFHSGRVASTNSATSTGEVESANPVNTVDYGPAKSTDNQPVPDKNPNLTPETPTNSELAVVITSYRKSGDLFLIKAVIAGTDTATCEATMTKGSLSASGSSGASTIEGQYSCKDLSIPMSQLTESGEWNLTVTVTDKTGAKISASTKVII